MNRFRSVGKRSFIGLMAMASLLFFPVATFAESPINNSESTQATNGPTSPPGADGGTYHYNEETGLWENDHYTWDPVTKKTAPKQPTEYSYNPATGKWDSTEWRYDAPSEKYVPQTVSTDHTPEKNAATPKKTPSPETQGSTRPDAGAAFDSFYNAAISNNINSLATTGNATVSGNTTGGNATTGNALAMATILNMLQTSWGMQGSDITTFMADIHGDVVGDFLIDPTLLSSGDLSVGPANNTDIDINVSADTAIHNNINLAAHSGNATVSNNTSAGDAITGTAAAVVNVLNLINSAISAGDSFVGNINIHGNLEGDILLPEDLKNQLLASNVPTTTVNPSQFENGETLEEFVSNTAVTNTVSLGAASGNATVDGNSNAGNATTGAANTNVTLFNLTGREIVGNNGLLVFVNVLGEWVGLIVDAPAGATSAMVGSGLTSDNQLGGTASGTQNSSINNNISAQATTGDATVSSNTSAGSATSGSASASANIANITNSSLSFADWFGVLFINVFGSWHGSFGVDTAMGDPDPAGPPQQNNGNGNAPSRSVQVFTFAPGNSGTPRVEPASISKVIKSQLASAASYTAESESQKQPQILGSTDRNNGSGTTDKQFNVGLAAAGIIASLALLALGKLAHGRHAARRLTRPAPQIIR